MSIAIDKYVLCVKEHSVYFVASHAIFKRLSSVLVEHVLEKRKQLLNSKQNRGITLINTMPFELFNTSQKARHVMSKLIATQHGLFYMIQ